LSSSAAYAILSDDTALGAVASVAAGTRDLILTASADELVAAIAGNRLATVVVDGGVGNDRAAAVLRALSELDSASRPVVVMLRRDRGSVPDGADVVAPPEALGELLEVAGDQAAAPLAVDALLGVTSLGGAVDARLESAADELAAGFGVERCLISVRGDSIGAATGDRTWTSLHWDQTAARCRAAGAAEATFLFPGEGDRGGWESYLVATLPGARGGGFLGLVAEGPRVFLASERSALAAVAGRLGAELEWRSLHDRAVQELDGAAHEPGLDKVLGTWNRAALEQLAAMLLAGARRTGEPLSAVVFDVIGLQAINNRHGLAEGDRLLRRLAAAVRTKVREEDLVGRWGGDELAVMLRNTAPDVARRVAERLLMGLESRPFELAAGGTLRIAASAGVAGIRDGESAAQLISRAARGARRAQDRGERVAATATTGRLSGRIAEPLDVVPEDAGAILGSYRLLHEISRGGMGVVYRAVDRSLERPVAIKMLRPDLAEISEIVEHFRTEAAMLARLQHPNLVQVYSFGDSGGELYFVMELVEGESLGQAFDRCRLEGASFPPSALATVALQVASALDALHERGIVHRDVKPANVILDPFRARSVLVDVGIARRFGQSTVSAGTPGYVAPEVIDGEEATARSDVYGLAATAYAMLVLEPPWGAGDTHEILARQRRGKLRPPSELRPPLAPLDRLFTRSLSVASAARPRSAGVFARELSRLLGEVGVVEGEPPAPSPSAAVSPGSRGAGPTEPGGARTRGVVFRSVARAVGVREAERLRDAIAYEHPELARALAHGTAPLAWLPTSLLTELFELAPTHLGRDRLRMARDVARAAVRSSFRRFFPASSATLVPERTLSAIRSVWSRYHSWGAVSSMPIDAGAVVVRLAEPIDETMCAWAGGMLEQLAVLSGAAETDVRHQSCALRGAEACLFEVAWQRPT
jgi:diguanylate cyclase (GGDEF)-like protein